MGGEAKDACAMGVLILNIKEVCPDLFDEIIVYHNGISENDKRIMSSLFQVKFVDYCFHIPFKSKILNSSIRGFSEMVFFKYEIFRLIKEYNRVVLTDYDVIFQNNLNNTISQFDNGNWFYNNGTIFEKFWKHLIKFNTKEISEYNMDEKGVSAPLIVINQNSINLEQTEDIYKYLKKMTLKLSSCIKCPEEAILSLAVQKFNIHYNTIDKDEFVYDCKKGENPDVSILHCIGRPKFWDGYQNDIWNRRYNHWIKLGGSKYHEPLKKRLIRYTYDISVRNLLKSFLASIKSRL